MTTRTFKVGDHAHLTLPIELASAPGVNHMRLKPGEVIELDEDRCNTFQRFIAGRVRAGDLVELAAGTPAPAPTPAPEPMAIPETLELPAIPKKGK